jgi:hypothetical protein
MLADYTHFKFWCQKVLPIVYDDSLSSMELMGKVVDYLNKIIDEQKELVDMFSPVGGTITELQTEIKNITDEIEKVKKGDYVSLYLGSLISYIDRNLQQLVSRIVKFISFELDESGSLIANIPDTWDFLRFDTDVDTNSETYGHLILEW